jgi:hypothetical protein
VEKAKKAEPVEDADEWNIEWKAEENKTKKETEQEGIKKPESVKLTTATATKTTTTALSPIKAAAEAETTSAPAKLPDGVLLARVTQRSIFVRGLCMCVCVCVSCFLHLTDRKHTIFTFLLSPPPPPT